MKKISHRFDVKLSFAELPEDDDELTVYGNEELLFAAFKNIVLNACKYSSDKRANVSLSYNEKNLVIVIEDNGPGIAQDEQELIFRPFYRSADTNSLISGSGLGLPLANQVIKLYGGNIVLTSQLGIGSVFTITLKRSSSFNVSSSKA